MKKDIHSEETVNCEVWWKVREEEKEDQKLECWVKRVNSYQLPELRCRTMFMRRRNGKELEVFNL